jgi:hypothetical protein
VQSMGSPGSLRTACREGADNESPEPLVGRLGLSGHSEGIAYKPRCGEVAMCWRVGRMGPISVLSSALLRRVQVPLALK